MAPYGKMQVDYLLEAAAGKAFPAKTNLTEGGQK